MGGEKCLELSVISAKRVKGKVSIWLRDSGTDRDRKQNWVSCVTLRPRGRVVGQKADGKGVNEPLNGRKKGHNTKSR